MFKQIRNIEFLKKVVWMFHDIYGFENLILDFRMSAFNFGSKNIVSCNYNFRTNRFLKFLPTLQYPFVWRLTKPSLNFFNGTMVVHQFRMCIQEVQIKFFFLYRINIVWKTIYQIKTIISRVLTLLASKFHEFWVKREL